MSEPGPSPQVLWVLTPETAQWLNQRFHAANSGLRLTPYAILLPRSAPAMGLYYRIQAVPKR